MKNILITLPATEAQKKRLEQNLADYAFRYIPRLQVSKEDVQSAEFIIGNVPPEFLCASPQLKLLQLNSAGTDGYTTPGVLAPETILTNATGAYGKSVAEHMFAMLLSLQKKLHFYRDDQFSGHWNDHGNITSISDSVVLIVGMGDIGKYFGKMAKALGAHVLGVKRRPSVCPPEADELFLMDNLETIVPHADVIVSFLPNTPATVRIYNEEFFKKMKTTAIFMNAGRGNAVDQDALLNALQTGEIFGAGLDVTDPEPLPPEHPLWKEPKVLITPHISGQYHLPETLDRIVEIAASNIENYLAGRPLKNVIDFETGYCK